MVPGHAPAPSSTALILVPSTNVLGKRVLIGLYGADTRAIRGKYSLNQSNRISFLVLGKSSPFGYCLG